MADGILLENGVFINKRCGSHNDLIRSVYKCNSNDMVRVALDKNAIIFIEYKNMFGISESYLDYVLLENITNEQKKWIIEHSLEGSDYYINIRQQLSINNYCLENSIEPVTNIYFRKKCYECEHFVDCDNYFQNKQNFSYFCFN